MSLRAIGCAWVRAGVLPLLGLLLPSAPARAAEDPPAGLSRAEWSEIQRSIQENGYRVEPAHQGKCELFARNPEQRYATTFRRGGVEIAGGRRGRAGWRLALALTGYGYEGDVRDLADAEPVAANDRVEYRRGSVTEWYVNRPGGLEQGFTLAEPEPRASRTIVLAMAIGGDLEVRVADGGAGSFRDAAGRTRLRYEKLAAWDADGQPLGSRLEGSGGELRVVVEAGDARFPVTVDPVFVQEAKLEGHGDPGIGEEGGRNGHSVSISGDTLLAGTLSDAAYVFVRTGAVWKQQQRLTASDVPFGNMFGGSVALSGDTAVISAEFDTDGGVLAGAAYVFVRTGTVWTEQQKLKASDAAAGDVFGRSVTVFGDTAVVGAPYDDTPAGVEAGSAYVFVRTGSVWTEQQKLVAADGAPVDVFGSAVSISDDTIVATAVAGDTPGGGDAGAAYVFVRTGVAWSEQQKLLASDGAAGDFFGSSVSVSGDTALIGASEDETAAGVKAGSGYVFVRSGTVWSEQQKLVASDGMADARFGTSVSLSGDVAVLGAYLDDAPAVDAGSAYVFVRTGTVWSEQQKLVARDGAALDYFGLSVAASGGTAVIGAYRHDAPGGVAAGAVYVFVSSGSVWTEQQQVLATDSTAGDRFFSVSVSGDTAVVGAWKDNTAAGQDAGSAYVFVRTGTVWREQQKLAASDGAAGDEFGWAVAVMGDTLVVGAPVDDTPAGMDAGSAYVFVRTGTVWSEQQKLTASDGTPVAVFGASVSMFGDTVVVGATEADTVIASTGAAYVFVRSGSVWAEQQKLSASSGSFLDQIGQSVSISGNTVVVGAPGDDTAGSSAGAAYVFVRSGMVWSEQQKLIASDAAWGDSFGSSVSVSGDTAAAGAHRADAPGSDSGAAYVFVRSGTVWSEQQKLLASDTAAGALFGSSVSVSGDTAVIGAIEIDTVGGVDPGSVYVFARSGTLWTEQGKVVAADGAPDDSFGASVSVSGDTLMVGAFSDNTTGGVDTGSAYAFRLVASTDAGVTKTDGQASAVPGTPVTYTLTVGDAGPDPGVGVRVVDAPPAAMGNVSWSCAATPGSWCPASGTGSIDHTVNVDVGGALTYTFTGTVASSATGSLVNTVTVTPPAGVTDPVPANDSATDSDVLTPQADLGLTLTDAPDPVGSGGTLTYTLDVANLGPSDSSGATVTDTLPGVLTLLSASPGCSEAGGTVTCVLGGSAAGSSQSMTLQAVVNPGTVGSLTNTASLVGSEPDPVAGNDTDTELTQVSLRELTPGGKLAADLGAPGGILADQDIYRIGQKPYSSYEVVVDGTSGDIGSAQGPELDRLASDATTVLQSSATAGAGASRSLRWENDTAGVVDDQYVRVRSAGCTTTCGPEDVYRIRTFDTTLLAPRFNNSGTQVTVLVLHNTTDGPVSGHMYFWNAPGVLAGTQAFTAGPKAGLVMDSSVVPGVAGQSGAITLSHDGPYGALVGKAVALEPATGFTFDTALAPRQR